MTTVVERDFPVLIPGNDDAEYLFQVETKGRGLRYIPNDKRTAKVCLAAVQRNGYALEFVPNDKHTNEIFLVAVQKNGYALRYVPVDKRTPEVCLTAVQQDGDALQFVKNKTDDIIIAALRHGNRDVLQYIPDIEGFKARYNATYK